MSLSEVGAAVSVLLGLAPPASLPPDSSSKVELITSTSFLLYCCHFMSNFVDWLHFLAVG